MIDILQEQHFTILGGISISLINLKYMIIIMGAESTFLAIFSNQIMGKELKNDILKLYFRATNSRATLYDD